MNIDRFDSDRNDDNKYTRAMYFDMLELYKKAPTHLSIVERLGGN